MKTKKEKSYPKFDQEQFGQDVWKCFSVELPAPVPVPEEVCEFVGLDTRAQIDPRVFREIILQADEKWSGTPEQIDRLLAMLRSLRTAAKKATRGTFYFQYREPSGSANRMVDKIELKCKLDENEFLEIVYCVYRSK